MPMTYYQNADRYDLLPHPFKDFIPPGARYLVVGTFPAHTRSFKFYYSGEGNRFWEVLGLVFNHTFNVFSGDEAVKERKRFLTAQLIGMTDMHQLCYRKNKSSGDENLYPVFLTDIFDLLDQNPSVTTLVLTSRTDAVGALGLLKIYFMQKGLTLPDQETIRHNILYTTFKHQNRAIDVYIPISPSRRVEHYSLQKLTVMYRYIFSDP